MANRFWVGGTGTWDASDTTHWAATSGGAGGQSVPGSADDVTLDGSSGAGTVTVNATLNVKSLTCGAFTGTLDFSANNNNVTFQTVSISGAGTRTINLGSGTWTLTGTAGTIWNAGTITGLTFSGASATLNFASGATSSQRTFTPNALTYGTITIPANSSLGVFNLNWVASCVLTTLNISGPNFVTLPASVTGTVTNAFAIAGTSSALISIMVTSPGNNNATISTAAGSPTLDYCVLRNMTFGGGATFTATHTIDLGGNTGITGQSTSLPGGGGARVIGG